MGTILLPKWCIDVPVGRFVVLQSIIPGAACIEIAQNSWVAAVARGQAAVFKHNQ